MTNKYVWEVVIEVGVTIRDPLRFVADDINKAIAMATDLANKEWAGKCWSIISVNKLKYFVYIRKGENDALP